MSQLLQVFAGRSEGGGLSNVLYQFDGSTMYATMPGWDVLGDYAIYSTQTYDGVAGFIEDVDGVAEMGRIGAVYSTGFFSNLALTDNSPIQDTDYVVGDGIRSGAIPAITMTGGTITFDYIHQVADHTILDGSVPILTSVASVLTAGANTSAITMDGVAYAGAALAAGQHCTISMTVSAGTLTTIGVLPTSGGMQNLVVVDSGDTYTYPLNEGSGTVINNTDPQTGAPIPKITDPGFDDPSSWFVYNPAEAQVAGGVFDVFATTASSLFIRPEPALDAEVGRYYRLRYTMARNGGTEGQTRVSFGGVFSAFIGDGPVDEILGPTTTTATAALSRGGTDWQGTIDNFQIEALSQGEWTPDADWVNVPDNSRFYPMDEGTGDTFVDQIGGHDATIQNFNEANWQEP